MSKNGREGVYTLSGWLHLKQNDDLHPMRNVEQLEKCAGILHENLCLITENMKPFERLSHFGIPSALEVNLQEFVLKHPTFSTSQQEADIQSCLGGVTV
uniref:Uncharacterized protein n=2 Tax=Oryza TaxID=4527 RepID=A0A0E0J688_ORYNI